MEYSYKEAGQAKEAQIVKKVGMLNDGGREFIIRVLIISITKVDVSAGLIIVSPVFSLGHQTSALRIVLLLLSLAALGTKLLG